MDAANGNDAANGLTLATAWRTLGKANGTAQPGDLFLLTGTFLNQFIRPERSGTATQRIVFKALAGSPAAVLDHGQYDVILWLDGRSYLTIDGLEIRNDVSPIALRGGANNNILRNLWVHDVGGAIQIIQSSDNLLENNRISRCGTAATNTGDCIWIANGANRNVISNNTIEYAGHGTIFIGGDNASMAPSDDNVVTSNDLSNPWAANVGLIGHARRTVVERNKIHDSSTSGINYARTGLQISAEGSIVRFNEVYANTSDGIQLQAYIFGGMVENATGNQVYHNVVWGNGGAGMQMLQKENAEVKDNVVANNVFWGNNAASGADNSRFYHGGYQDIWVDLYNSGTLWAAGSLNGNVIRNNILGKDAADAGGAWLIIVRRAAVGDNVYYTMGQAQSSLPGVIGNMQVDPLFVNAAGHDFRLQSGSPAIDAGWIIPGLSYLGAAPDIGAYEQRGSGLSLKGVK